MGLSRKTQLCSLSCLIACVAVISCGPLGTQTASEKPQGEGAETKVDREKSTLSKEQILEAADAALRRKGLNPENFSVVYDEGNTFWNDPDRLERLPSGPHPGRDWQTVLYIPGGGPCWALGGEVLVDIDRNNGEVLAILMLD